VWSEVLAANVRARVAAYVACHSSLQRPAPTRGAESLLTNSSLRTADPIRIRPGFNILVRIAGHHRPTAVVPHAYGRPASAESLTGPCNTTGSTATLVTAPLHAFVLRAAAISDRQQPQMQARELLVAARWPLDSHSQARGSGAPQHPEGWLCRVR
jgi:hypothetical protein